MRKQIFFLILIILGGLFLRLYKFNAPIADWHSWRQVDTSAVSRNFIKEGIDPLHPKFDDLSNVQTSGKYNNPQGYRFVEFPIYNVLQAGGFLIFDKFTLEEWGRIITILSSLISTIFLFLIVRRFGNSVSAILAAFFYSFLPFNIFWGRTVLPDQSMIMATLGGIYFFSKWMDSLKIKKTVEKYLFFILTIVFLASALLLKPLAAFFFLPILALSFEKWKFSIFKRLDLWIIAIFSFLPLFFWRIWMLQFPQGIADSTWLFEGSLRFKGAFFYWIFANRIGEFILGFWGLPILVLGIIRRNKNLLFLSFLVSSLLYIFVVARGNVQHSYYQIPIIPTICIFLALGSELLINPPKQYFLKYKSLVVLLFSVLLMFSLSWKDVRDYYNIQNQSVITAGQAVDKIAPKDTEVVAPYEGDTTLLYYTKRKGWASFSKPLPELIKMGADYLVLVNPKEQDLEIGKTYKVVASSSQYLIFDLHKNP